MLTQYYLIHDLVTVRITRRSNHPLDHYLTGTLAQYTVDTPNADPDLDIRINVDRIDDRPGGGGTIVDNQWFVNDRCIASECTHKGGRWKAVLEVSEEEAGSFTLRIKTNHLGRMIYPSDLVYPMIRVLMNLKGAADVHGASVCDNHRGYLFAGRSGVGKTVTAVNFLRKGYRLLGDDECWLRNREILSYLTPINIRYTYDPQSALGITLTPRQKLSVQAKKWLSLLSAGHVTLFTRFRPEELLQTHTASKARLHKAYLLVPGQNFDIERDVEKSELIEQMVTNNQFEMRGFEGFRLAWTHIHPESRLAHYWNRHTDNLGKALAHAKCARISVPREYTPEIFERILEDIET